MRKLKEKFNFGDECWERVSENDEKYCYKVKNGDKYSYYISFNKKVFQMDGEEPREVRPAIRYESDNWFKVFTNKKEAIEWMNSKIKKCIKISEKIKGGRKGKLLVVYDLSGNEVMRFEKSSECAKYFNVSVSLISQCVTTNGRIFKKKYKLKYE